MISKKHTDSKNLNTLPNKSQVFQACSLAALSSRAPRHMPFVLHMTQVDDANLLSLARLLGVLGFEKFVDSS